MKAIILAAGSGSRLMPLTKDKPKCLVEYNGKAMLNYQIDALRANDINDIAIIRGYKGDVISESDVTYFENKDFEKTNMVYTLFKALEFMDDDLIISYGDIIYGKEIIQQLIASNAPIATTIDLNWKSLWEARMEDPLSDAETLKLDEKKNIIEIGKKPKSLDEVEGQYMGLIKFSKEKLKDIISFYNKLDKDQTYDGKDYNNMYMTSFLQLIIDHLHPIQAVPISGPWLEVDSTDDLKVEITIN